MSGWVTVEGVNGAGKTYLARRAVDRLGAECLPLVELPDQDAPTLPGKIISVLGESGDAFLRGGHPRTETLMLAALHVHRYEAIDPGRRVVLEDRGPHTVAVYQAVILAPEATDAQLLGRAHQILDLIEQWRPLPGLVLLIHDAPAMCLARFQSRIGRRATSDECMLMKRAARLYGLLAAADPGRIRVVDRTALSEDEAVEAIVTACQNTRKKEAMA